MPDINSIIQDPNRIAAVRELGVLNARLHEPLDRLTRRAARAVDAPVASISLLDGEHEYFVSAHGVPATGAAPLQCPVQRSICQFTVAGGAPLPITDVRAVSGIPGPIVLGGQEIVAYLGVPLRLDDGHVVGALCVVDGRPREWSEPEIAVLTELAGEIVEFLSLRTQVLNRVLHDPVTNVPGHTLFLARCDATRGLIRPGRSAMYCIELSAPEPGRAPSSVRIDDAALREVARVLAEAVGSTAILGRLRDNGFAAFVHELADERDALRVAGRLRAALRESAAGAEHRADAARIGIALGDAATETAAELVGRAEHVMRGAASDGAIIQLAARAA